MSHRSDPIEVNMTTHLDLDDVCAGNPLARQELDTLRTDLANARAADIHSCHDGCKRAGCVNARLRERVKVLDDALATIERTCLVDYPPSKIVLLDIAHIAVSARDAP